MTARATHPEPSVSERPSFRIRRGLDLPIAGAPEPDVVEDGPPVARVALLGADAPGVRPELRVERGARVRAGDPLFVDRRRPAVRFPSPGTGVVEAIERGPRRRLEAVVVRLDEPDEPPPPAKPEGDGLRETLLASGLWTTLRTRPFGRIPDPDDSPHAVFVTAMTTDPGTPPVERAIGERAEDFARGVAALAELTEGRVWVCARPDAALPEVGHARVGFAGFDGPHPAGLPGTHVHHLAPASAERRSWHVGWADVLDVGRLVATGRLPLERRVALSGPGLARPRVVRTRIGASTEDLVRGALDPAAMGRVRVVSGPLLSGHAAAGSRAHLGRLHTQVCVLPEDEATRTHGWLVPGPRGRARRVFAGWRRALGGWRSAPPEPATTALGGRSAAFFPMERMERAFPLDLPLLPLLRALLVGDEETARALGALELVEEDLALVTYLCPAKLDYGALLRAALDAIEKEG